MEIQKKNTKITKMFSVLLKLALFVTILNLTVGLPLGADDSDVSEFYSILFESKINKSKISYEYQENLVWVPVPLSYFQRISAVSHSHKAWPKRNSELITSLLGIDKNFEMVGK